MSGFLYVVLRWFGFGLNLFQSLTDVFICAKNLVSKDLLLSAQFGI
jgi:hypothetical protein